MLVGYLPDVSGFSVVASPAEKRRASDGQRIGPDESQQNGGLDSAQFGAAAAAAAAAVVIGEGPAPVGRAVHDQLTSPQRQRRQCRDRTDSYITSSNHRQLVLLFIIYYYSNRFQFEVKMTHHLIRRTCGGHDHGVGDAQFITERPIVLQCSCS